MSGTIDEVLWTIFTFYSLNGNPKDPSRLNKTGLLKLCKDGKLLIIRDWCSRQFYFILLFISSAFYHYENISSNFCHDIFDVGSLLCLVMALDSMMTEKPLIQADLELIYTSEIRNPKKVQLQS